MYGLSEDRLSIINILPWSQSLESIIPKWSGGHIFQTLHPHRNAMWCCPRGTHDCTRTSGHANQSCTVYCIYLSYYPLSVANAGHQTCTALASPYSDSLSG